MKSKYLNGLNVYILAWCVLNLQVISNSLISVACLGLLLVFSMFTMFKDLCETNSKPLTALVLFVFIISIYGFVFIASGERLYLPVGEGRYINNREYLILIYQSILPIFPFYYYARRNILTKDLMLKWTYVFFFVVVITYIKNQIFGVSIGQDDITNNASYNFLALFPLFALFNDKKILRNTFFLISIIFIFLSVKRGAILICIFAYSWFLLTSSGKSTTSKLRTIIFFIVVIFSLYQLFKYLIITNDYFHYRFEETLAGNSSGRDKLFSSLLNSYFYDSTFVQQVFGRGAYGTLKMANNVAHNDWLELLIDTGLVGFLAYLIYWLRLIRTWLLSKVNKDIYQPLGLFVIIYFSKTFFSMSYSDMPIYTTIVLGYCLANLNGRQRVVYK